MADRLARSSMFQKKEEEFQVHMRAAMTIHPEEVSKDYVVREWESCKAAFERTHLELEVSRGEHWLRLMNGVAGRWKPPRLSVEQLEMLIHRLEIAHTFATRVNTWERNPYCGHNAGFWKRVSAIGADVIISGATMVLLFINAIHELIGQIHVDGALNATTMAAYVVTTMLPTTTTTSTAAPTGNFSFGNDTTTTYSSPLLIPEISTHYEPYTKSLVESAGPILRICMNLLALGFGRAKEVIVEAAEKYEEELELLERVLGSDKKGNGWDSERTISDFRGKIGYWKKYKDTFVAGRFDTKESIQENLQKSRDKLLRLKDTPGITSGGCLEGDDSFKRMVKEKRPNKCRQLFSSTFGRLQIGIEELLVIKGGMYDVRRLMFLVLTTGLKKIDAGNRDLREELEVIKRHYDNLKGEFARLREIPTEDAEMLKKVKCIEKAIKILVEVTAFFIVAYDQYTELVGDPILAIILSAFFLYLFGFTLTRFTEAVNIRRAKLRVERKVARRLLRYEGYLDEMDRLRKFFTRESERSSAEGPSAGTGDRVQARCVRRRFETLKMREARSPRSRGREEAVASEDYDLEAFLTATDNKTKRIAARALRRGRQGCRCCLRTKKFVQKEEEGQKEVVGLEEVVVERKHPPVQRVPTSELRIDTARGRVRRSSLEDRSRHILRKYGKTPSSRDLLELTRGVDHLQWHEVREAVKSVPLAKDLFTGDMFNFGAGALGANGFGEDSDSSDEGKESIDLTASDEGSGGESEKEKLGSGLPRDGNLTEVLKDLEEVFEGEDGF